MVSLGSSAFLCCCRDSWLSHTSVPTLGINCTRTHFSVFLLPSSNNFPQDQEIPSSFLVKECLTLVFFLLFPFCLTFLASCLLLDEKFFGYLHLASSSSWLPRHRTTAEGRSETSAFLLSHSLLFPWSFTINPPSSLDSNRVFAFHLFLHNTIHQHLLFLSHAHHSLSLHQALRGNKYTLFVTLLSYISTRSARIHQNGQRY